MQLGPQLLNLVSAIPLLYLLVQPAQPMAVPTQLCQMPDAAKDAQDIKVVICGSPIPAGSGDATDIPFACHRQVAGLQNLLTKEPGLQALSADKICYLSYREIDSSHVTLNLDVVASQFSKPVRVRLLPSVSELVGISPTLVITGKSLSSINPEVFKAMGPTQKETLKYLVLSDTGLASIDLSLLEPLKISGLLLMNNVQLNRTTNFNGVKLPTLTELVVYNSNPGLIDCRNFMSLPEGLTSLFLLQNTWNNCAFCYLPKAVTKISVLPAIASLPYYPSAVATDSAMPFPLDRPYGYIDTIPTPEMYKEYSVNASSASGCQSACPCQQWSQTTSTASPARKPDTSDSKAVSGGSSSKNNEVISGGSSSKSNEVISGGSSSKSNEVSSGSSGGEGGVVKQSSSSGGGGGGSKASSRLEASATGLLLAAAALAMAGAHL